MTTEHKPHLERHLASDTAIFLVNNPHEATVSDALKLARALLSLEEQYQAALDLLSRVQPELAPNLAEADELRRKFGLGGGEPILYEIADFLTVAHGSLPSPGGLPSASRATP